MKRSILLIALIIVTVSVGYAQQDADSAKDQIDLMRYGDFKHTRIFEKVYFFSVGDALNLGIDMFDESPDGLAQYLRHRVRTHLPTIPILNIYDEVDNDPAVQALSKAMRETGGQKRLVEAYVKMRGELKLKVEQRYKAQYGNKAIGYLSCTVDVKGVAYPIVYHVTCGAGGGIDGLQTRLWQLDTFGYGSPDNLITRIKTDLDMLMLHFARVFYNVRGDKNLMQRATISLAQTTLKEEGVYHGAIDGVLGPATQEAIRRYQQTRNLPITGTLDKATLSALKIY